MTAQFEDGKDEGALRTIGEVGQALDIKPHVLRYWEEQFPTLEPLKRSGNRRYYRPGDVALIETINRLVNVEGYTIKGARVAIEEGRADMAGLQAAMPMCRTTESRRLRCPILFCLPNLPMQAPENVRRALPQQTPTDGLPWPRRSQS